MSQDSTAPVALVGGVSGGIGRATAARLTAAGWQVTGYARDRDRLDALAAEQPKLHLFTADATRPDEAQHAVEETVQRFGRLDAYVHAVGSILLKPAHLTTPEEFQEVLATNLTSAFLTLRAAVGPMRRQRSGAVVLVGSVAGQVGLPNHEAIAAAKAGVAGLAVSAAASYANQGIRVNVVAPGTVETPLSARITGSPEARRITEAMHPLGRIGQPGEVASLIAWLVSADAGWITGQVWSADGGMAAVIPRQKR